MTTPKEGRYSLSGTAGRSPTKPGGMRRLSTLDTATSSARRPASELNDRPEERVKVFVRIRPTKADGETTGAIKAKTDGKGLVIFREHANIPSSEFEFDRVLGPGASQSDVYHAAVKPIVEDVLNGYNGTLMAYGQTGAGKTYSLSSIAADAIGMIPRAAAEVFSHIEQDAGHEYSVYMSYVQLYMELIQDLLRPESENLQIRENEGGVFVGGVHQQEVQNITQCLHLLHLGDRNRTTAFTALNAHSSRSHAVVMLTVIKRRSVAGTGEAQIQRVKVGKLFLVDLAGSERLKKSKSTGLRANEAKSINLSLTTLGMCINARADPTATHVPFRDSKLTRLLQDSLGGNAKTSLLVAACDATEHVDETLQSLQFGLRAMCVRTQAVVNERVDYKTLHAEMIAALQTQDRKSSLLEASLLEKDAQLEAVQARLQQDQQEAAQRLERLQREREVLEKERLRLLAEQEAKLEAEAQHKAQLLQRLEASSQEAQGREQQHEQQRQMLLQEVAAQQQQLAEAKAAAAKTAERHAAMLDEQRQAHAVELATAAAQHEVTVAAAVAAQGEELAAVQAELEQTRKLLRGSREEARMLSEHHEQQLKELEEDWAAKVQEAEKTGERQVAAIQATVAARDDTIVQLQADVQGRDDSIEQLHELVVSLEAGKVELARQLAVVTAQLEVAGRLRLQLERALAEERELAAVLHMQVEGYERSRMALAKSFFENKRSSDAAKVIQRGWREHRLRRMRQQQTEGYQALTNAKAMLGTLAQQHADLEQQRRANLAFSGQTLVGDNLDVLQDAVESIIAAFLLPARDLRTIQRYQQKVSAFAVPSSTWQSMVHPGARAPTPVPNGGLFRSSTGIDADLIKAAVYPPADSVPSSARSTPREMAAGSEGSAPGQVPAVAQYTQQYVQQQEAAAQQGQGQLLREGSLRGGLASLGAKVLAGVNSPMDRLRRLSSGHYQQQAAGRQPPPQMPLQAARHFY